MADFDAVVIGGGTGNRVAKSAADEGYSVALVEPGPLGGTCLNRGCNPSKMLLQRADIVNSVRGAERFGVDASVADVAYADVVDEVNDELATLAEQKAQTFRDHENVTLFREETRFVDERTVELDGERVTGERVVVATGSRPIAPDAIDGLDEVDYLTSDDAVKLRERPDRLVVAGGGYIAAELGYFFELMGTEVIVVQQDETLVPREDPDVAEAFTAVARERHEVHTGFRVEAVEETGDGVRVSAAAEDGETVDVEGDEVLVSLGRRPNTDRINVEAAGIETDDDGFVTTDERLRSTSAENVWAQGDIADNYMFKHSGDYEAEVVVDNAFRGKERAADFSGMVHAVFTEPQLAGTGETERELDEADEAYVVGREEFSNTAMGRAKKLDRGFVKVLASPEGDLLGCHIVGPEASALVHEPALAMRRAEGTVADLAETIHVHPTLNKALGFAAQDALDELE